MADTNPCADFKTIVAAFELERADLDVLEEVQEVVWASSVYKPDEEEPDDEPWVIQSRVQLYGLLRIAKALEDLRQQL